ncbi:MAG: SDR family oxidoreductase [Eubacteriales bacterium]
MKAQVDLGLNNKVAIVTGGGSNIGRSIAHTLAREKAAVIIADVDDKQGDKVKNEIELFGGRVMSIKTDVTDHDSVEAMVKKVLDFFPTIDILINNAGWTRDLLFMEKPRSEWEKEIAINLWGVINCCRAVLDLMIGQKSGKIVNIASDVGRVGEYKEAVYGACKAGVIALGKALAREVGRYQININSVCPASTPPVDEDSYGEISLWKEMAVLFTPEIREKARKAYSLRGLGTAQDIADMVVFLCSDRAGFVTGQAISVSGGYTMV